MKIAVVLENFNRQGGIERTAVEISERLALRGHQVHLFARTFADLTPELTIQHRVRAPARPWFAQTLVFPFASTAALQQDRFDVVHNHGCGPCLSQHIITVTSVHRHWIAYKLKQRQFASLMLNPDHVIALALEQWNYGHRRFHQVIAVSNNVRRDLIRYFRLPDDRITTIPNGVDLARFRPPDAAQRAALRARLGIPPNVFAVLFVGKEFRRKGLGTVIGALAHLNNASVHLYVVGGDYSQPYLLQAQDLGIRDRLTFIGHSESVADIFGACDIFVLPTMYDAFGMVVVEAMATGLPVIVSREAGVSEFLRHDYDALLLDEPTDAAGLEIALRRMLTNSKAREQLGRNAVMTSQQFDWEKITDQYEQLYEIIGRRRWLRGGLARS